MKTDIIITGAAGFIGSCIAAHFKNKGHDVLLIDDFSKKEKDNNTQQFETELKVNRTHFIENINDFNCNYIIHLGARTNTTEMDYSIHEKLNLEYSKTIWNFCTQKNIPLIYASSAATYGGGEHGYNDSHEIINSLEPLNPYGVSKNEFDKFAISKDVQPPKWHGLKFFNIYGPNEYHKGRMASVIFHAYNQIQETHEMKLFKSHKPNYKNGEQQRDFVYIKDLVQVIDWLFHNDATNGIYNLGTGQARTFKDLAQGVFDALALEANISFIDTPEDIRDKYQYYTEANMDKLKKEGYNHPFTKLEDGIEDYVKNYLNNTSYY